MKFEMFTEVQLAQDLPKYNLLQGATAIIVDYCPRPEGQENGYILEVLDENDTGFKVIAVAESQIASLVSSRN